ncbi:MAG: vWA domain-containing protein [Pirellulales bacterium]
MKASLVAVVLVASAVMLGCGRSGREAAKSSTGYAEKPADSGVVQERLSRAPAAGEAKADMLAADPAAPDDVLAEVRQQRGEFNTESYDTIVENPFLAVAQEPLSTFSIDVDTASYANVRRFLMRGAAPPKGAVRIEEMVNYFSYQYAPPTGDVPFAVACEIAACPWNGEHRLARIGLKGKEIAQKQRPASNLVFLLDVSGSMADANKLPLLKEGMKLLASNLTENDRVAIVVYAGSSGLVLDSTAGDQKETILGALDQLQADGTTNGGEGIALAYQTAAAHFIKGGVNRVILATDGDFNVGTTNQGDLVQLIEDKAKTGVFLSVLGFGGGNYKDSTMEKLADKGNGNYAYIDSLKEARKVLVEQMSGTLVTIAKDVKIQVDFNPARVAAYRLIGYENRLLAKEDFTDDTKDAGEIGAGHTVTALYELVPPGKDVAVPKVEPSRYREPGQLTAAADSGELFTVRLRYKAPDGNQSQPLAFPANDGGAPFGKASADFKFAASVAAFGLLLRDSKYKGTATLDAVLKMARESKGEDKNGYRAEFIQLVNLAKSLHVAYLDRSNDTAEIRQVQRLEGRQR